MLEITSGPPLNNNNIAFPIQLGPQIRRNNNFSQFLIAGQPFGRLLSHPNSSFLPISAMFPSTNMVRTSTPVFNGGFNVSPPLWLPSILAHLPSIFHQPPQQIPISSLQNTPKTTFPDKKPVNPTPPKLFRPWQDSEEEDHKNLKNDQMKHQAQLEVFATNLGKTAVGHRCIYCAKIYSRKYGLKIHLRTHTGFKPLECKFCHRPFGDPSNLNKHTRLHAESRISGKQHPCGICGKLLARKRDLERHVATKHSERVKMDQPRSSDTSGSSSSSSHLNNTSELRHLKIEI